MKRLLVACMLCATVAHAEDKRARALLDGAMASSSAYDYVRELVDTVGARKAGSVGAAHAVEWGVQVMQRIGLRNVRREPVKVPKWVRTAESVELLSPIARRLHAVALGGSVATPPDGVTAEIVEVTSLEAVRQLGDRAKGKIIFFNKPMSRTVDFMGYEGVVGIRGHGATEAAKVGAVGALYRSAGTARGQVPHTGMMRYDEAFPKIAIAALSLEDADLLHRLLEANKSVRVRLKIAAEWQGEVDSANVVGEIAGREPELVLIGCHLDSWDIGTGAIDDGAGCGIVLDTARLILAQHEKPRRTIRVVLFMNEEHGLSGAKAYAVTHKSELALHTAALEADAGAGRPYGVYVAGEGPTLERVKEMIAPLSSLGVTDVKKTDEAGADLIPIQGAGPVVMSLMQDMTQYFDWHHTEGDTLDKIDPETLKKAVAAFAVLTHALSESPTRLPASPPLP